MHSPSLLQARLKWGEFELDLLQQHGRPTTSSVLHIFTQVAPRSRQQMKPQVKGRTDPFHVPPHGNEQCCPVSASAAPSC